MEDLFRVSAVCESPDSFRPKCWYCPLFHCARKRKTVKRDDQKLKLKKQFCREYVDGGEAGLGFLIPC